MPFHRVGESFLVLNRNLGFPSDNGLALPYTFDPSGLGNGALPSPWVGSTFAISSGVIVNTPTLGSELLPDPGLEGNYTGGVNDNLTKGGTPTCTQSADVHGGSKAQEIAADTAGQYLWAYSAAVEAFEWYLASSWAKRTAGTGYLNLVLLQTGQFPATCGASLVAAAYTQYWASALSVDAVNAMFVFTPIFASSATVIVDDISFKKITKSSTYALLESNTADVVVKVRTPGLHASWPDDTHIGAIIRANALTNPNNWILGYVKRRLNGNTLGVAGILKCVNGTISNVLSDTIVTLAANADIELRASGTTIQLFYNGVQVSTDKTVSDASISGNTKIGIFSAGGNSISRFFAQAN